MGYPPVREQRCEVDCRTGEYGDASVEVSADVRDKLVLVLPAGEHDLLVLRPAKALELAAVLIKMAGAALGASPLLAGCERRQLVRVAQAVDSLLGPRLSSVTSM